MEELKAIAKFVEGFRPQDLLREIYGDAAKPGAKQAGKALETVLGFGNTLLLPLTFANDRAKVFRKNMEKYRARMQDTPIEDTCEVAPEIGVPIAEKLAYVTNEELSEMYVELLAKASQVQHANVAHPSFVNIINNLSPDEALLLRSHKDAGSASRVFRLLKRALRRQPMETFFVLDPLAVMIAHYGDLTYPNNIPAYFSNLEGLGLIVIRTDRTIALENIYEPIETDVLERHSEDIRRSGDRKVEFQRGAIEFTQFGLLFLQACFSSQHTKKE